MKKYRRYNFINWLKKFPPEKKITKGSKCCPISKYGVSKLEWHSGGALLGRAITVDEEVTIAIDKYRDTSKINGWRNMTAEDILDAIKEV